MKIISHRGNIRGSIPEKENKPSYIDSALDNGYDVEIDIRYINNELWLGHDEPQYKIEHSWLEERKKHIWIHCKNYAASSECRFYNSFCHDSDSFVYTSNRMIWLHPDHISQCNINNITIIPLADKLTLESFIHTNIVGNLYGICTDYPILLKE